ncbi:MAG: hypothetical protein HQM08_17570 [Candidatus Riflebacteria bacterium]|nr:hypothetical protein [Candidatus Riflebacteria bacterium]
MKTEQIRKAFKTITQEAADDVLLSKQITEKLAIQNSLIPVNELKKLFWQFFAIIITTAVLYLAVAFISTPIVDNFKLENLEEQNTVLLWQSIDFASNIHQILSCFMFGVLRAFIILLTLAFILTAAAMPARRSTENNGGVLCAS